MMFRITTLVIAVLTACTTSAFAKDTAGSTDLTNLVDTSFSFRPVAPHAAPAVTVTAQEESATSRYHEDLDVGPFVGFSIDPDTFIFGVRGEGFIEPTITTGPMLRFGFGDDWTLVMPSWTLKWFPAAVHDGDGGFPSRLHPYLEGGVGVIWGEKDRDNRSDKDDFGVLLSLGFGVDIVADENLVIGTGILVDIFPIDIVDEHVMLSWHLISIEFRF